MVTALSWEVFVAYYILFSYLQTNQPSTTRLSQSYDTEYYADRSSW